MDLDTRMKSTEPNWKVEQVKIEDTSMLKLDDLKNLWQWSKASYLHAKKIVKQTVKKIIKLDLAFELKKPRQTEGAATLQFAAS